MNSSRGKGICGVVAIKIFAARGDGKRKEDRARGCACRSKGRLGRRAGQFGCRLVGQFGCLSVGQVLCRFADLRLPVAGSAEETAGGCLVGVPGGRKRKSMKRRHGEKVVTNAPAETKWKGPAG